MSEDQTAAAQIIDSVAKALHPFGLDIVHGFNGAQYNQLMLEHPTVPPLPLFGRPAALALLVGNTKALWQPFLDDCKRNPALKEVADPIDRYVERLIHQTVSKIKTPSHVRFSHDKGDGFVSLLHAAKASGFAQISPAHIAIHPTYGLWFGMRAVITFDVSPQENETDISAFACNACDAPCRNILDKLLLDKGNSWDACTWQERASVRDACPVGAESRYCETQNYYHYTKDKSVLYPNQ